MATYLYFLFLDIPLNQEVPGCFVTQYTEEDQEKISYSKTAFVGAFATQAQAREVFDRFDYSGVICQGAVNHVRPFMNLFKREWLRDPEISETCASLTSATAPPRWNMPDQGGP